MNWKNRLTNYNFWISIVSAVLLILQAFKFEFDIVNINEIATAVLGLLVVIGIISDPTKSSTKQSDLNISNKDSNSKEEEQIPSEQENEADAIFSKDDFKVLIEKISSDLKSSLNLETKLEEIQTEATAENENPDILEENVNLEEHEEEVESEQMVEEITNQEETMLEDNVLDIQEKIIENVNEMVEIEVNELVSKNEISNKQMNGTEKVEEINKTEEEKIECYNIVNN